MEELISFVVGILVSLMSVSFFIYVVIIKKNDEREKEKKIFQLVEDSKDIVYYLELKPTIRYKYLSPSIDKVLGEGMVEKCYQNPTTHYELIHPEDYEILTRKLEGNIDYSQPIVLRWRNQDGIYIYFEEFSTPIYKKDQLVAIQGIIRNIDEKIKLQKDLEYRLCHDALTGIYNRCYFEDHMQHLNTECDVPIGLILCDLDDLKEMNDTYGHKTGDLLIKEVSQLLNEFSNEYTSVARIGGDEFAIFIQDQSEEYIKTKMEMITKEIDEFNLQHSHMNIKASIGYSYNVSSIGKMNTLFIEADSSMYKDKDKRKRDMETSLVQN
jgi:diguanylate cyclase (GGDEF)-like protein/PAS domain S-box-containing protein